MSSIDIDEVSSGSSMDTFAPVAVYRLKYYKPESLFDNVLYALIRPPRFVYNQKLLVPGRRYRQRFDYQVHNIPFPLSIYWAQNPQYIILYLHGNSSSRFQGYLHLKQLPEGACLACFDFKGCGLRKDGKYITLGKEQSVEVDIAVEYLKTYGYPIVGWGRSMGAVSLLMSSKCQIMIADSPFASLYNLCKQTSLNFVPTALCCLVHCLFPCIFCCVRTGVENKSGMDPNELQIIKAVQKLPETKSLLIMAGKQDSMIHYSHASKLHEAFKGKQKRLILFEGTHNSTRPTQVLDQCFEFIDACIEETQPTKGKLENPLDRPSQFKVLKVDRQSSKQSLLVNHQTVPMIDHRDLQSSKQTLIMNLKAPIQLRPLKVGPSKSSPKKLSKIQGDLQQTEQANIQINQEQDIIREGIGKFQQNIVSKGQQKMTFKFISQKNHIQNAEPQSIKLKSIKPIHQISFYQQKPPTKNQNEKSNKRQENSQQNKQKESMNMKARESLASFINQSNQAQHQKLDQINNGVQKQQKIDLEFKEIHKSIQEIQKSTMVHEQNLSGSRTPQKTDKSLNLQNLDENVLVNSQLEKPVHKGLMQPNSEELTLTDLRNLGTPLSQPSCLLYEDVKLLDQDIDSTPEPQSTKQLIKTPRETHIELFLNTQAKINPPLIKNNIQKNLTPRVQPNPIPDLVDNRVSVDNLKPKKILLKKPQNYQQIHGAQVLQVDQEQIKDQPRKTTTQD